MSKSDVYRAMKGRMHGDDKAHFPWGQGEFESYTRFVDPVYMLLKHKHPSRHSHDPVTCEYLFNPYLDRLLFENIPPHDADRSIASRRRLWKRCAEFADRSRDPD